MAVNLAQEFALPQLAAQNVTALRQLFQTIDAESCPNTYNFHMHTVCSDGRLRPERLMEQAIAIGLRGLAITDHHSVKGYELAQDWLDYWTFQNPGAIAPQLWTGVEITSELLGIEVHILGYAFDPHHIALAPYLLGYTPLEDNHAEQVIQAIHAAGGVAVLAHPARYRKSPEDLVAASVHLGIDGVETYYAYNNPNPWRPSPHQTQQVKHLGEQYHLFHTCGTDTHGENLLQRL
jgi:predicted metal-dependent phosphoesterase TrpH